jgi:hypothetical protein
MGKFGKIKLKRKEEISMTIPCSEKKELGNKKKKRTIKIPMLSIDSKASEYFSGKIATITRPPSKGGIGIRLKTARKIFI